MTHFQTEILAPISSHGIYVHYRRHPHADAEAVMQALQSLQTSDITQKIVVGLGADLLDFLHVTIPGMRRFPSYTNTKIDLHTDDSDLLLWFKSEQRGDLFFATQHIRELLAPAFAITHQVSAFRYQSGNDLTGYEDGTENPVDDAAIACAFLHSDDSRLDGSSYLAVQQWQHNFPAFNAMTSTQQDHMIGRRLHDNEELDDAPASAHVKRTAQENFTPEAFILRRSMPWVEQQEAGLYFTAFGHSFDAFEAQLQHMLGLDDGVVDALFQVSRPILSTYFWCPPMQKGRLNFSALGLN